MRINKNCKHNSPRTGESGFTMMEMIIVIMITSILGTVIIQIVNKCLGAQINMQNRKERSDDAILSMDRINRELRDAKIIYYAGNNMLIFQKNATSSSDTNTIVEYVRDIPTNRLMRQSAATLGGLPGNSTSGSVIATNVLSFYTVDVTLSRVNIQLVFADGSDWQTRVLPRNYGL